MLQDSDISEPIVLCHTDVVGKMAQCLGSYSAASYAGDRWHARVIPPTNDFFVYDLKQLAHAHHGVGEVQPCKLVLVGQGTGQREMFKDPIVKRTMNFEFESADRVRHAFDVIAEAMGEVVQRVDAPFATRVV